MLTWYDCQLIKRLCFKYNIDHNFRMCDYYKGTQTDSYKSIKDDIKKYETLHDLKGLINGYLNYNDES
jgi:hypothetical protein